MNNNNILDMSDDDEEIIQFIEYIRRPYIIRNRENYFEHYDDEDFFVRFRLPKETVLYIVEMIEEEIEIITDRSYSISPINQLLLPLHFYATGGFLLTVADTLKVSKSSVSKIIKKVSFAIAALAPRYIKLRMNEAEPTEAKASFFEKATLPRIIGSLDCTHVKIQSPGGNNAELFRNRKGYFSINVQIISSTNLRILNIVARWPGSSHDQTIFDSSSIKQRLLNNEFGNSW